jgi:hypothetical protein
LALLELVERDAAFEEWIEVASRWAASFALCAASSFDMYLEFRRYDGTKKEPESILVDMVLPTMLANFLEYDGRCVCFLHEPKPIVFKSGSCPGVGRW